MASANPEFSSTFKTVDSREKYLSKILIRYKEGSSLDENDSNNVKDFYQKYYQPTNKEIIKYDISEIDDIKVEPNEYSNQRKPTKCLNFYFKGKKKGCVIAKYLLEGHKSKTSLRNPSLVHLRRRFRNLIIPQVDEKKRNDPDPDPSRNIADHKVTFEKLFQTFVEEESLKNFNGKYIPKNIEEKWIKFHKENAKLTLMTESEHKKKTDDDRRNNWGKSKDDGGPESKKAKCSEKY